MLFSLHFLFFFCICIGVSVLPFLSLSLCLSLSHVFCLTHARTFLGLLQSMNESCTLAVIFWRFRFLCFPFPAYFDLLVVVFCFVRSLTVSLPASSLAMISFSQRATYHFAIAIATTTATMTFYDDFSYYYTLPYNTINTIQYSTYSYRYTCHVFCPSRSFSSTSVLFECDGERGAPRE